MNKLTTYILIAFLCLEYSYAETTDSLKNTLLLEQYDTTKVKTLAKLGFEYAFIQADSSRKYSKAAIDLSDKIQFIKGKADGYNSLAISYDIEGNHEIAIKYFLKALAFYTKIDFKEGQARIYNNCGMVYQSLGDTLKSLEFHLKSLAIEKELGDTLGIAYSLIQVAALHLAMDQFDLAEENYQSALTLLEPMNDNQGLAYIHWGLSELYLYTDQLSLSILHSDMAIDLFKQEENNKGIAESTLIKGRVLILQEDFVNAENELKKALNLSLSLEATNVILECYKSFTELYKIQGKYHLALANHEQLSYLIDTIRKEEMAASIRDIELKYDFDSQQKEIELLNTEKAYETKIKNIAIGVAAIILILLALLFYAYMSKSGTMKVLKIKNEEIEKQHQIIKQQKENALAAIKAKSEFLSVMSHEIRTPMNVIIGSTYLLLEDNPKPSQLENINLLKFSAENLLTLLNDILDINKLESGKIELESVPFQMNLLLKGIIKGFEPEVRKKNITLNLKVDEKVPSQVIGDPGRLTQVLNNLVGNAIKFTEDGFVTLKIKVLKETSKKTKLKFIVEDTGIGIPEEKQKLIFKNFTQADSRTNRKYGGTGLGLAITKHILKLFGSEIELTSQAGKGSTFSFKMKFKTELQSVKSYT